MGHISFVGKLDGETLKGGAPALTPGWTLGPDGETFPGLLAYIGGSAGPQQPRHARLQWRHRPQLPAQQRGRPQAAHRKAERTDAAADQVRGSRPRVPRGTVRSKPVRRSANSRWQAWRIKSARFVSATIRKRSALDANCKAHDVDNLYVVDGSIFCSSGAVNPALTIMANALRVGDHLIQRMK